ncbi:tetraspanin-8-like isoform X2 [Denticeps clupeoides]|uniref:Tetraspanin n=1 Tax=Denticeps clupeoides TaxID=299321 RepID=A0AAY4BN00_9TELE|nr:tetraspanin-8-like isoform X2 [Denticeps clupeoides]
MVSANSLLKALFIFFNQLFVVVGGVIFSLGLLCHVFTNEAEFEERKMGIFYLYLVGALTIIIALLGAYGAHKEKKSMLIVFFVGMCLACSVMLRFAVPSAIIRPQMEEAVESYFRSLVPLDRTPPSTRHMAELLQAQFKCCGIFNGYKDWQRIPQSCVCQDDEFENCDSVSLTPYETLFSQRVTMVYTQSCGPMLVNYVVKIFDIWLGICFGLAALALLGVVMSSLLLVQMKPPKFRRPMIFSLSSHPPKYSELINESSKSDGGHGW